MISYVRGMVNTGYLTNKELKFLQKGVVFKGIKIGYFGMEAETLYKRAFYMQNSKGYQATLIQNCRPESNESPQR